MSNILLGLVLIACNAITPIINSLTWWAVVGMCCGAMLVGYGLREVTYE